VGPVTSYPNPVLRSVAVRTLGPFLPVWLAGLVLGLALDQLGPAGALDHAQVLAFLGFYTLLSWALFIGLFLRQYQSTPQSVRIDVEGVAADLPRRGGSVPGNLRTLTLPYARISTLVGGGLTGWRIEGRPEGIGRLDWINLTEENAGRVADAMEAWRERESAEGLPTGSSA